MCNIFGLFKCFFLKTFFLQLMKGSAGSELGMGPLNTLRDNRSNTSGGNTSGPRPTPRPAALPRAVEVLTARPILRDEQISSLDDISKDAGWAQHDDIDYEYV